MYFKEEIKEFLFFNIIYIFKDIHVVLILICYSSVESNFKIKFIYIQHVIKKITLHNYSLKAGCFNSNNGKLSRTKETFHNTKSTVELIQFK